MSMKFRGGAMFVGRGGGQRRFEEGEEKAATTPARDNDSHTRTTATDYVEKKKTSLPIWTWQIYMHPPVRRESADRAPKHSSWLPS